MGVGNYVEADVLAAARVFTGWGAAARRRPRRRRRRRTTSSSSTRTTTTRPPRTFTFAIYPDGGKTIPARAGGAGHAGRARSDRSRSRGIRRPPIAWRASSTSSSSARRSAPDAARRSAIWPTSTCRTTATSRRCCAGCSRPTRSSAPSSQRYSWPVEFVVRSIKETGLERVVGRRGDDAARQHGAAALRAARRQRLGARRRVVLDRRRCSSRMNFAATLMGNQKFNLGRELQPYRQIAGPGARLHAEPLHLRADHAGCLQRAARIRARRRRVDGQRHAAQQQGRRARRG